MIGFVRPGRRSLRRFAALLAALALVPGPAAAGVRLLAPGEEMAPLSDAAGAWPAGLSPDPKLGVVRLAVTGVDARRLADMAPYAAPFEIVAASAAPDLVWDAGTKIARAKGDVIAYDVARDDLPGVIDRMAMARGLAGLVAARPQPIRLFGAATTKRRGERVEIELADMRGRALVLFSVSGDGLVQALYPIGADPRIVATPQFRWMFQVREPFGTDLIVAVSAPQPMTALERAVKQLSRHRGAGEVLRAFAGAAPADARIGVASLSSAP